ncbi:MAG: hypothetical protein E7294_07990 [Lachnospiraceae bacterium]|nr:hypothetical protein [Lachnospiraceae bacterium]
MEKTQNQRVCYRCLMREYDEQKFRDTLEKYIEKIGTDLRTEEAQYRKRLELCKRCEKLNQGTCLACGCYVELRAAAISGRCPDKKW